jgi:hypothetical protein
MRQRSGKYAAILHQPRSKFMATMRQCCGNSAATVAATDTEVHVCRDFAANLPQICCEFAELYKKSRCNAL